MQRRWLAIKGFHVPLSFGQWLEDKWNDVFDRGSPPERTKLSRNEEKAAMRYAAKHSLKQVDADKTAPESMRHRAKPHAVTEAEAKLHNEPNLHNKLASGRKGAELV